jgi:integrase
VAITTKEELFEAVKEARKVLTKHLPGLRPGERDGVSSKTVKDYARIGRARLDIDDPDQGGQLMSGVTRQSWHKVRAALLHEAERQAREQLRLCDALQRAWRAAVTEEEKQDALELASQAASRARTAAYALVWICDKEPPPDRSEPKASKRRSLPPAKDGDWRAQLYETATPTRKPSLAALWAGVRPAELESGVWVEMHRGQVVLTVFGAKTGPHSGQEVRRLFFSVETPLGKALAEHAGPGGRRQVITRKATRLNKDFQKLRNARVLKKGISPYSLRHAFCADLKADGIPPDDIARAMGHASARSQGHYGSVKQGRGGTGLEYVEGTQAVRTDWNRGTKPGPVSSSDKPHNALDESGPRF